MRTVLLANTRERHETEKINYYASRFDSGENVHTRNVCIAVQISRRR